MTCRSHCFTGRTNECARTCTWQLLQRANQRAWAEQSTRGLALRGLHANGAALLETARGGAH